MTATAAPDDRLSRPPNLRDLFHAHCQLID